MTDVRQPTIGGSSLSRWGHASPYLCPILYFLRIPSLSPLCASLIYHYLRSFSFRILFIFDLLPSVLFLLLLCPYDPGNPVWNAISSTASARPCAAGAKCLFRMRNRPNVRLLYRCLTPTETCSSVMHWKVAPRFDMLGAILVGNQRLQFSPNLRYPILPLPSLPFFYISSFLSHPPKSS